MTIVDIIAHYHDAILAGLWGTIKLSLVVWLAGLVCGGFLGVAGARSPFWIGGISRVMSFLLSGIPILVLLFWLHYPAQAVLGIVVHPFYTAALALSLVNLIAVADTVRAAILSLPNQYVLVGRLCGLSERDTLRHITAPLVARSVVGPLLAIQVNMLQATLFASLISVEEVFRVAQRINASEYRPVEIYSLLALLFLGVCLPMNGLAYYLQRRFPATQQAR